MKPMELRQQVLPSAFFLGGGRARGLPVQFVPTACEPIIISK